MQQHQDDGCEDCEKEKKQNSLLIAMYERLQAVTSKASQINHHLQKHRSQSKSHEQEFGKINQKICSNPQDYLKNIQQRDSKDMGYQLASALIERQIKVKAQNSRLQSLVTQLMKDKREKNNRENESFLSYRHSKYNDAIDQIRQTKDSQHFRLNNSVRLEQKEDKQTKYWEAASTRQTKFNIFEKPAKQTQGSDYSGLNLWLYQYKPQDFDLFTPSTKSNVSTRKNTFGKNSLRSKKY